MMKNLFPERGSHLSEVTKQDRESWDRSLSLLIPKSDFFYHPALGHEDTEEEKKIKQFGVKQGWRGT